MMRALLSGVIKRFISAFHLSMKFLGVSLIVINFIIFIIIALLLKPLEIYSNTTFNAYLRPLYLLNLARKCILL